MDRLPTGSIDHFKNSNKILCSCDYITPGCGCKKGYVRHPSGKCCHPSGCPPPDTSCGGKCTADQIKKQIGGSGNKGRNQTLFLKNSDYYRGTVPWVPHQTVSFGHW